jgi:hypothetical protein
MRTAAALVAALSAGPVFAASASGEEARAKAAETAAKSRGATKWANTRPVSRSSGRRRRIERAFWRRASRSRRPSQRRRASTLAPTRRRRRGRSKRPVHTHRRKPRLHLRAVVPPKPSSSKAPARHGGLDCRQYFYNTGNVVSLTDALMKRFHRGARGNLQQADRAIVAERGVSCCYAKSDKYWVTDPRGIAWESFRSLGSVPFYGEESQSAPAACGSGESTGCCVPGPERQRPTAQAAGCCAGAD